MTLKIKTMFKTVAIIAAVGLIAVSCKKEQAGTEELLTANGKRSSNISALSSTCDTSSYKVLGRGGYSRTRVGFDTVYVDLNTPDQDSLSTFTDVNAWFTSSSNSFISTPGTLKYLLAPGKAICDLTLSDYATATTASIVGMNTGGGTPNGWYNYVAPNGPTPIPNFYVFINDGVDTYAIQLVAFTDAISWGSGVNLQNKANTVIRYRKL
ncbi:hypothetical protein [Pedobacter hiemivivus]|uniref:Uncharacterized protein n=1 Tax=Pedobacter hiemivivus TaxID=2530454 RepID=A0A4R0NK93_9SPHI|nr:hypothetical protein [Pedobacter hiemivivus]TCC99364.1 hypothetical protein EZ444_01410 [Pedobacter hiemivivus]